MATVLWQRIRDGIARPAPGHEESLRRLALRLAAQTVLLLLIMLIALEVIVYAVTQHTLMQSLQTNLTNHAHPPPDLFRPEHGPGHHRPPPRNQGDASTVYLDQHLHVIRSFGPLGGTIVDPSAAGQSLRTMRQQPFTTQARNGQAYLVYTTVTHVQGRLVVVQASISEDQYQSALNTLRQSLIIVALLGLLTSGIISAVLVNRSLRPIRVAIKRQRDFVADAAHELRTPLAIMRTVGEVGLNAPSGDDQQATIEQMLAENRHLTRLVDDLSLLARADSHTITIERAPLDLSSLVTDTVEELRPLAEEQEVRLDVGAQGTIRVVGDVIRLRQLLLILLDNALKHTPAGGTIAVRLSSQGGRARLHVVDSGPGIDPVHLPRIFDRFYRADQARTGEGSGLGLAIARWIVDAHGGHIQAENAPGQGAMFTVTLPAVRGTAPLSAPDRAPTTP